ncbi:NUDIX hydrolase [Dictyobacter kobayashii]|uniref:NUDIX hydrolase n=1 Tax=Dictyobacter kobayashii TaxID=2014872 RepID=UPI0013875F44|nr:NUDIX hydrolase [Dictyobacter kobayashii]
MHQNVRPRTAAAVLRHNNTEILLVQHLWSNGNTSWLLPGGGYCPANSLARTASRYWAR